MKAIFYGRAGEMIGRELELPPPSGPLTVGAVRALAAQLRPEAAEALMNPSLRACVEDVFVPDDHLVPEGARVEFLPPLSGG